MDIFTYLVFTLFTSLEQIPQFQALVCSTIDLKYPLLWKEIIQIGDDDDGVFCLF